MATLTVRNLSEETLAKFRVRAAQRGRSMEAEARDAICALADGAQLLSIPPRPNVEARVAEVHELLRARLGALPEGRVDAFIAERKAAAERGE